MQEKKPERDQKCESERGVSGRQSGTSRPGLERTLYKTGSLKGVLFLCFPMNDLKRMKNKKECNARERDIERARKE